MIACAASGQTIETTACPRGCEAGACRRATPCALFVASRIRPGERYTANLCDQSSTIANQPGRFCGRAADGPEVLLALLVERRTALTLKARDVDPDVDFLPIVHLRHACADPQSEFACDVGATLERVFDPGDVFVVVDSSGRCGRVEVSVSDD